VTVAEQAGSTVLGALGKSGGHHRAIQTYRQVLAGHRGAAYTAVSVSVAAGAAEALGLASLVPLLQRGVAHASSGGAVYVPLFFLCTVFAVVLRVGAEILIARLSGRLERKLRIELLDGLLRIDWRQFASLRSGDLVSALMSEATQVANGASALLTGVSALTVALVFAVTAGVLGGTLTAGAVIVVAASVWIYRRATRIATRCQKRFGNENADLNEEVATLLHGLKYFRSSGTTHRWQKQLSQGTERVRRLQLRNISTPLVTRGAVETIGALFLAGVLLTAILRGRDFATALLFVAVFYRTMPKIQAAQGQLLTARAQTIWWDRWSSRRDWIAETADRRNGRRAVPEAIRSIELQDVTVQVPGRAESALHSASVHLRCGWTYAVIGETGSGKSTLLDVVTGLIRPDQGSILVDGVPLDEYSVHQWQNRIAFVPQEPVVFHNTIGHNIVWPDTAGGQESVHAALDAAQLSAFVATLRHGLETSVGQHGGALSGGQRQRLGVARALFANRPVLILDEATGALDPDTEARLLDEVILASADRITLFVTHRHEAARRADEVIVVHEGRITMIGSPEEILGGTRATV
jgi:ABC-type multidrug transport system fused ATPase/permease subunit